MEIYDNDARCWRRIRVLVPLGCGPGEVLFAYRRLDDHQRVLVYRSGEEVEVPG